jgi:hypothetical protein
LSKIKGKFAIANKLICISFGSKVHENRINLICLFCDLIYFYFILFEDIQDFFYKEKKLTQNYANKKKVKREKDLHI